VVAEWYARRRVYCFCFFFKKGWVSGLGVVGWVCGGLGVVGGEREVVVVVVEEGRLRWRGRCGVLGGVDTVCYKVGE